jgi:hypothetical protein
MEKIFKEELCCENTCGECVFPGYESLCDVFSMAIARAATGKGKERHASPGEKFEDQFICRGTREEGHGAPRFQAIKKITEAKRLDKDAAIKELLDAMVYLAADVIVLSEELEITKKKGGEDW